MVSPWWKEDVQQQSKPFQTALEPTLYYVEGFSVVQQRQSNILPESLHQPVQALGQGWARQSNIIQSNILHDSPLTLQDAPSASACVDSESLDHIELQNVNHRPVSAPVTIDMESNQKNTQSNPEILKSSSLDLSETLANFNQDIDALLGEKKKDQPIAEAEAEAEIVKQKSDELQPAHSSHDIFDQMGASMRYANTFNFGDVDLSDRFDDFDKSLGIERSFAASTPELVKDFAFDELELDDLDLVHELATIDEM